MDFPYGTIIPAPPHFAPPEVWPEYAHVADPIYICRREALKEYPSGIRWSLWPLCFEEYIGDLKPDTLKSGTGELTYNRIAIWRRISRTDVPPGWYQFSNKASQVDGFRSLEQDTTAGWHKNARRDLRIWLDTHLNKTHTIEQISLETYADAYAQSLIAKRVDTDRLQHLTRKMLHPSAATHVELWGVRDKATRRIVAGTGIVFSPTHQSATHMAPFIQEEARSIFAATGLIHHWFSEAKRRNMRYVVTTNFWYPSKPKDWKGFSEFKSHFGFEYIAYPPLLWRFVPGKFW